MMTTTIMTTKNGKTFTTKTARRLNFDQYPVHNALTSVESQSTTAVNADRELSRAGAMMSKAKETGREIEIKTETESKQQTTNNQ